MFSKKIKCVLLKILNTILIICSQVFHKNKEKKEFFVFLKHNVSYNVAMFAFQR